MAYERNASPYLHKEDINKYDAFNNTDVHTYAEYPFRRHASMTPIMPLLMDLLKAVCPSTAKI